MFNKHTQNQARNKATKKSEAKDPGVFPLNHSGQGLIEYLIIVALVAVATIGVMRVVGQSVSSRFATISEALQGRKKTFSVETIDDSQVGKKDLGDFMNGVGGRENHGAGTR